MCRSSSIHACAQALTQVRAGRCTRPVTPLQAPVRGETTMQLDISSWRLTTATPAVWHQEVCDLAARCLNVAACIRTIHTTTCQLGSPKPQGEHAWTNMNVFARGFLARFPVSCLARVPRRFGFGRFTMFTASLLCLLTEFVSPESYRRRAARAQAQREFLARLPVSVGRPREFTAVCAVPPKASAAPQRKERAGAQAASRSSSRAKFSSEWRGGKWRQPLLLFAI